MRMMGRRIPAKSQNRNGPPIDSLAAEARSNGEDLDTGTGDPVSSRGADSPSVRLTETDEAPGQDAMDTHEGASGTKSGEAPASPASQAGRSSGRESSMPDTLPLSPADATASSLPPMARGASPAGGTRKSARSTRAKGIDYANLDQHLPASVDRWICTIEQRTASGQIVSGFAESTEGGRAGGAGWRRFKDGHELDRLGDEWIYGAASTDPGEDEAPGQGWRRGEGMTEPFVIEKPEGLGMEMPRGGRLSVRQVADIIGADTPLEVIDCASQSALANWTLGQWADYYEDPKRDKIRNVISLEVTETTLGKMIKAPKLVRYLDWVESIWPSDMKAPGEYPRVQKYCLMSVERCWTDWHVDFAGSSVFYHVLRGGKTFFFIRPTPENLKAYEEWSGSSERQEQTWLGDSCDRVYRMDLEEGNTAFIPTGWIHAVYTPSDSLVIGGNFLHSLNIPTQLRVYEIELATKVPRKFRYPHFVKLLWFVARHYHKLLASPTFLATPPADRPAELRSPRVLEGLKQLSSFLIQQTTRFARGAQVSNERRRFARENVPWRKIPDPVGLSRDFRKVVLRALGQEPDPECFLSHVAQGDDEEKPRPVNGAGAKRKASVEATGDAAGDAKRTKDVRVASAFITNGGSSADGEIIGRHIVPVTTSSRWEHRLDPGSIAAPTPAPGPAAWSEIKESRSTQSVVRRWASDPTDPSGQSGPVVETRTVVTIVERVKFPPPGPTAPR
ncbi:JmjC domain-containing histone demethylation protein 1 [Rhodotorula sphaerocarpa]